jgi:hypothetical protein
MENLTKEQAFVYALYLNGTPEQRAELEEIAKSYAANPTAKTKVGQWLSDAAHAFNVNMSNLPKAINETLTAVVDPLKTQTTTTTTTEKPKEPAKDNTLLYAGIAGGAVLLILIVFFFIYKKP